MSKKLNIRINKVYTKRGDKGKTQLIGRKNVSKSDLRVECYGEIDELNSSLGFCKSLIKCDKLENSESLLKSMNKIQNDLFNLGTMLATTDSGQLDKLPSIGEKEVSDLESLIDLYNENLEELKSFVLPSGSLLGAYFHVCRTVCRRSERKCVLLASSEAVDDVIIIYLNRLSDLFFVWSRWINKKLNLDEDLWTP